MSGRPQGFLTSSEPEMQYADTLHTSSHTQKFHKQLQSHRHTHICTQTPTSLIFISRACPPWLLMEKQSKLRSVKVRGGNHRGCMLGKCACLRACVHMCLRWCDISGLTWSGTLPPRAWRELLGKDTDGGLGSPGRGGGGGISECEQKAWRCGRNNL